LKELADKKKDSRKCKAQDCSQRADDGNCSILGADGQSVQCVGPWAEDKYFFLERYLNASCEARRKFADKGNAVYIDLFSGPGRCIVREEKREIESGGIRALRRDEAPFNEFFYFDISTDNINALIQRVGIDSTRHVEKGDSNLLVSSLVKQLASKSYRYHFAFIDPYGPDNLKFTTLASLAKFKRMDLLIHFPIGAIKRNLKSWIKSKDTIFDEFMGTNIWRDKIKNIPGTDIFRVLLDIYGGQLQSIGYPEEGLRLAASDRNIYSGLPTVPVRNTKDVELYALILASKHELGQKIWNSVIKVSPVGQKSLF
jgi:three-Cys-motif partner protein